MRPGGAVARTSQRASDRRSIEVRQRALGRHGQMSRGRDRTNTATAALFKTELDSLNGRGCRRRIFRQFGNKTHQRMVIEPDLG